MKKKKFGGIVWIIISIFVCIITAFPIYWMINFSLKSTENLFAYPPEMFPRDINLSGYIQIFKTGDMLIWIKNSVIVALSSVILNLVAASLGAFGLSRYNFKVNRFFILLLMFVQMIAPALIIAPIYVLFAKMKLTDSLIGLAIANTGMTVAFSTWVLKGFFDNIPKEIDEAALIDGCSQLQIFRRIVLPLSTPALISIAIITFFDVYNEYMFAVTLVTNQNKWLGTVGLAANTTKQGVNWNIMLGQATLFCIVPILFFFIFQRYIVKGIGAGALKY